MRRIRAAAAVAATCLIACSIPGPTAPSTPAAGTSPSTQLIDVTATKAADLRTRLDLLLGEQVVIVAKESVAAAYETDAYPGYVALLGTNASALGNLLRQGFGNTSASMLETSWSQLNRDLVEYAVGLVTHKQDQADSSSADVTNAVVPALSALVSRLAHVPGAQITQLLTQQVLDTKLVIEDAVGQSFPKFYTDLHVVYAQSPRLGDLLAGRMAQLFPDKFPGDSAIQAVTLRVSLNLLLQEHAYLASMTTDATIAGRGADAAAAAAELQTNAISLSAVFTDLFGASAGKQLGLLWSARDAALLDYASGVATSTVTLTQDFVAGFSPLAHVAPALVSDQARAAVAVIDDQRAKSFGALAGDDRAAATALEPVADAMATAASVQG